MGGVRARCCALVLVAACGRVRFDPRADGGAENDVAPPDGGLICPNLYTRIDNGCYRFMINPTVELSWAAAEAACEADGPGAHLMVADDDAEMALAVAAFGTASDAWIGLSDRVTEGTYLTVNGATPHLVWAAGEPVAGPDCVQLLLGKEMATRDCTATNDYLCEADGLATVPSAF